MSSFPDDHRVWIFDVDSSRSHTQRRHPPMFVRYMEIRARALDISMKKDYFLEQKKLANSASKQVRLFERA